MKTRPHWVQLHQALIWSFTSEYTSSSPAHPSLNGHCCHILKNNILDFAAGRDKQEWLVEKKTNTFRLLSSSAYILWLYWRSQLFTTMAIFSYVPLYNRFPHSTYWDNYHISISSFQNNLTVQWTLVKSLQRVAAAGGTAEWWSN